jgi:hypothetical protein
MEMSRRKTRSIDEPIYNADSYLHSVKWEEGRIVKDHTWEQKIQQQQYNVTILLTEKIKKYFNTA